VLRGSFTATYNVFDDPQVVPVYNGSGEKTSFYIRHYCRTGTDSLESFIVVLIHLLFSIFSEVVWWIDCWDQSSGYLE